MNRAMLVAASIIAAIGLRGEKVWSLLQSNLNCADSIGKNGFKKVEK